MFAQLQALRAREKELEQIVNSQKQEQKLKDARAEAERLREM